MPTPIYEDNEAAMRLSENPVHHGMTKHIARRYHFIRQANDDASITLIPIDTKKNTADAFTKPLGPELFKRHRYYMGVRDAGLLMKRRNTEIMRSCYASRYNVYHPTPVDIAYIAWDRVSLKWEFTRCRQRMYRVC
mmetsp:Transcript_60873/g.125420  ORF Transcript_60873/g.125420 Transcript_60873/m.125420 type:complete len:136 (+) Transcript_60873:1177-1584(+)